MPKSKHTKQGSLNPRQWEKRQNKLKARRLAKEKQEQLLKAKDEALKLKDSAKVAKEKAKKTMESLEIKAPKKKGLFKRIFSRKKI